METRCDNVSMIESVVSSTSQLKGAKIKQLIAERRMKTLCTREAEV